ncbi:P-loop NTPase fold protein [uncultured Desulfuromusa sp.]|uniref:KAP family P-loop NTPase fold protein n=1 Tax=uncultured Desulfuromusa sp. TaxID=219183 RepID=UPI002AA8A677|nr:P-loop NTPase fold protein [uncultured Desulfuromusa sp.]
MFKSDQPIDSSKQDLLGRALFAQSFATALLSHKDNRSVVTALYGKWGAGKSSVINMALEHVQEKARNLGKEELPIVFKFNPWNFSDQNQLVSQFFKQLAYSLQHKDYGENAKEAGRKLEVYANLIAPLTLIPIPAVSGGVAALVAVLKGVGNAAISWGKKNQKDLAALKDDLNEILSRSKRKIIIVIDDIDRLNNAEIRQIFQLVKMLGDFSNTIYLLAFDQELVVNALSKVQEGPGLDYLEKIVQVPFELPQISKSEIESLLFSQLDELVADIPEGKWDSTYWGNIYHSGLRYLFENVRDVTRYINSLRFSFSMVRNYVNPVDFLAITGLQVFLPEVYSGIRENKDLFAGHFSGQRSDSAIEQTATRLKEILQRTEAMTHEQLSEFLTYIFPKLEIISSNMEYGSDWLGEWRKNGRVCSPDNFDIFFKLALPVGMISNKEMETILGLATDKEEFCVALQGLNSDGRIIKFLERIEDYTREDVPEENIANIVNVLMDIGDTFQEVEQGFLTTSTSMRILRIFYQLSQRFETHDRRFDLFKNAIDQAENSLYTIVHEVGVQGQQHGKNTSKEHPAPEEKRAVTGEQLEILEQLAVEKIKLWADSGALATHQDLVSILYCWERWDRGDSGAVKEYISNLIEEDVGLIQLLVSFMSKVSSHSKGDKVSKTKWKITLDNISNFVSIDLVEPRVRKILSSDGFDTLEDKQKLAINVFLDTFDGKVED